MSTTIQKSTVLSPGMLENNRKLETALMSSLLFDEMSVLDIEGCLTCSSSKIVAYEKGEPIFYMDDKPSKVMILLDGSVIVGRDTPEGRRIIMNTFDRPGDLFGEVYLFVNKKTYGHFAEADEKTQILQIPKEFIFHTCGNGCAYHSKLISNTLSVLAQKADYLNELCDKTQFIVITHRKGTMEAAHTMYGVTMEEKGISKCFSLQFKDSEEMEWIENGTV